MKPNHRIIQPSDSTQRQNESLLPKVLPEITQPKLKFSDRYNTHLLRHPMVSQYGHYSLLWCVIWVLSPTYSTIAMFLVFGWTDWNTFILICIFILSPTTMHTCEHVPRHSLIILWPWDIKRKSFWKLWPREYYIQRGFPFCTRGMGRTISWLYNLFPSIVRNKKSFNFL